MRNNMSILKKILYGVVFVTVFVGLWTLLDYLYTTLLRQSDYVFRPENSLTYPVGIAVVLYLILFIFVWNKKEK